MKKALVALAVIGLVSGCAAHKETSKPPAGYVQYNTGDRPQSLTTIVWVKDTSTKPLDRPGAVAISLGQSPRGNEAMVKHNAYPQARLFGDLSAEAKKAILLPGGSGKR